MREFARARQATVTYLPVTRPELRLDLATLPSYFALAQPGKPNLFAYVA